MPLLDDHRCRTWSARGLVWSTLALSMFDSTAWSSMQPAGHPPSPALPRRAGVDVGPRADLLLIVGAGGTDQYAALFNEWAARWRTAAERGQCQVTRIGTTDGPAKEPGNADAATPAAPDPAVETAVRDAVRDWLTAAAAETQRPLWIVCIGHGTDDGRVAKLALTGDDLTATEFAAWLAPLKRPVAIVQSTSCSGAFLEPLSAPGRVVVTSTKSGAEQNFAHLGGHIAAAWDDPASDLDQDQQVSLLEAFLVASRQVREFYESDNRLATEHALLDDTGDGQGTRPEAYMGTIPVRDPGTTAALDGYIAAQWVLNPSPAERALPDDFREQRDRLEQQLARMRELKSQVTEDEYYALLDPVLLELARLYATLEAK